MRVTAIALALAAVLAAFPAAAAAAPEALDKARERTQSDLDASLRELTDLREKIAAEKIPLSKRLVELEEQLVTLRRQNDDALRQVDFSALDASKVESELKLRRDELTYVGNLLDEYARNLETRLGVGEGELYRVFLAAARDASTNPDLTVDARFARQLEVVERSLRRIEDGIGGTRYDGSAIDSKGIVTEGTFAAVGPVAVFASKDGKTSGLALAETGTTKAVVRPLEASIGGAIVSLVRTGVGLLPVDPTRGGALKELIQKWSLLDIYRKGGPIMHPLLFVSILALAVVIERVIFLFGEQRKRDPKALQAVFAAAAGGQVDQAIKIGKASRYFVPRTLAYAIEHRERSLANALVVANTDVMKRFRRGINILDTAITIAPLLGLLGTVTGMMHSFSLIGGELSAPGAITGGIAEALIATAFGLVIAITCLVPYNYLNNRIEQVRQELESASAQIELLMEPQRGVVNALGAAHLAAQSVA